MCKTTMRAYICLSDLACFCFFFFFSIIIEANYKKKKEVQKNNITKTEGFITKNDLLSPFIHSYVAQLFLIPSKGLTEKS